MMHGKERHMEDDLITPREAAKLKGVTRGAIYTAIAEGRLPHTRVLGHIGVRKADVLAWTPIRYAGRPGRPSGRAVGTPLSEETKARISEGQKRRWAARKKAKSPKKVSRKNS